MSFDAYTYQRNKLRVIMFLGAYRDCKHLSRQIQVHKMMQMLRKWDPYKKMTTRTFKPRNTRSRLGAFNTQELYELMVEGSQLNKLLANTQNGIQSFFENQ